MFEVTKIIHQNHIITKYINMHLGHSRSWYVPYFPKTKTHNGNLFLSVYTFTAKISYIADLNISYLTHGGMGFTSPPPCIGGGGGGS